ncbi:DUF4236 domain-containing protein [Persicobacter psychrovividus]|uniref:DUF4236 domain-containing protein n=1 Tax=Persicobacter psychrovividus TaxID=387638 RepID=A0ABN6LJD3_9BACT|nr:hypothetical protein PEPS_43590 [Persicobacter psychrovividus]
MNFRKRITLIPGLLKVNLSKTGASLTIGPDGCNVNIGKKGTYLNTGIPGSGLYDRKKISGRSKQKP